MKFVVCYSGGHSSALVAIEAVRKAGKENVILLNHNISPEVEHEDIKRFKEEVANYLGINITYANMEGWENKTPLRVCRDLGGFKFGTSPVLCTTKLKTEPFHKWLKENYPVKKGKVRDDVTLLYGFDKNEPARIQRRSSILAEKGYKSDYPLAFWERTIYNTEEVNIMKPMTYELHKHANCFSGDTKFITDNGIKTLKECEGYTVNIITRNGWDSAKIKCFGEQEIIELTLKNNSRTRVIRTTANHRWITPKHGHKSFGYIEKLTSELKVGDIIPTNYTLPNIEPNIIGIQHGFVFGDGNLYNVNKKCETKSCALFSEGKLEMIKFFDGYKVTEKNRIYGLPKEFKSVPTGKESNEYLLGFLCGLIASDGVVNNRIKIQNKDNNVTIAIANIAKQLGMVAWSNAGKIRSTNYKENASLSTVTISKKTFKQQWLLRDFHNKNYKNGMEPYSWKVTDVKNTNSKENVYCAVVDGELKEFTLDDNILTGNCIGCLKAGAMSWYLVYCLYPELWREAVETENEIGFSILKDKFLEELEPKFKRMKCRGIVPSEKKNSKTFWSQVDKALGIEGQMSFLPCECSY